MFRKRTCWIIGCLVLAQVGIIVLYQGVMTGDASPASTPKVVSVAKKSPPAAKSAKSKQEKEPARPRKESPVPLLDDVKKVAPQSDKAESGPGLAALPLPGPSGPPPTLLPQVDASVVVPPPSEKPTAEPMANSAEIKPSSITDGPPAKAKTEGIILATHQTVDKAPPVGNDPVGPVAKEGPPPVTPDPQTTKPSEVVATPVPSTGEAVPVVPAPTIGPGPASGPVASGPPPVAPMGPVAPVPTTACPWTLQVSLVEGKTHLTAQSGKEICFKVVCEQLSLQAPKGNIEGQGAVKLTSSGLEGSCDHLTICWQEDQVVMDGQAQLKCQRDGQEIELKAGKLSLRLTPTQYPETGEPKPAKGKAKISTNGKQASATACPVSVFP